jgi:hypothetical protein
MDDEAVNDEPLGGCWVPESTNVFDEGFLPAARTGENYGCGNLAQR